MYIFKVLKSLTRIPRYLKLMNFVKENGLLGKDPKATDMYVYYQVVHVNSKDEDIIDFLLNYF